MEQYYPNCSNLHACAAADDVLQARERVDTFAAADNLTEPQKASEKIAKANLAEAQADADRYNSPPAATMRCIGCILNNGEFGR